MTLRRRHQTAMQKLGYDYGYARVDLDAVTHLQRWIDSDYGYGFFRQTAEAYEQAIHEIIEDAARADSDMMTAEQKSEAAHRLMHEFHPNQVAQTAFENLDPKQGLTDAQIAEHVSDFLKVHAGSYALDIVEHIRWEEPH